MNSWTKYYLKMIRCLFCPCRLSTISGLNHISQRIGLDLLSKNHNVLVSKRNCYNVDKTYNVSTSVEEKPIAFNEIYRFRSIRIGFYLQKLKWQQSVLAAVAIPSSLVLYFCGLIDSSCTVGVIVPGVMLTTNLFGLSYLFQNTVGFLYLNEDETTLKIAYLDPSGKRIDEEVSVSDVVPFMDAPRPPTDMLYKQLVFYSSDRLKLKLFLKMGQVTDKEKFDKVFGPLD